MLGGGERESGRATGRSLIIECTIAIEPSADFDSPKTPPEKLDAQVVGNTRTGISKFLRSLLHLKSGWWANLKRCIAAERSGASKYADG